MLLFFLFFNYPILKQEWVEVEGGGDAKKQVVSLYSPWEILKEEE